MQIPELGLAWRGDRGQLGRVDSEFRGSVGLELTPRIVQVGLGFENTLDIVGTFLLRLTLQWLPGLREEEGLLREEGIA